MKWNRRRRGRTSGERVRFFFCSMSALSSTDPVVLRDVIRDQRIPRSICHTLGIEAGTNDLVVLPIVLILIAVANGQLGEAGEWFTFGAQLFVLGPVAGFAVGAIGAWVLGKVDAWLGVDLTYQALYGWALSWAPTPRAWRWEAIAS